MVSCTALVLLFLVRPDADCSAWSIWLPGESSHLSEMSLRVKWYVKKPLIGRQETESTMVPTYVVKGGISMSLKKLGNVATGLSER